MFCPHCGFSNEEDARFCVQCGKAFTAPRSAGSIQKRIGVKKVATAAILILLIVGAAGYAFSPHYQTDEANKLIEQTNKAVADYNIALKDNTRLVESLKKAIEDLFRAAAVADVNSAQGSLKTISEIISKLESNLREMKDHVSKAELMERIKELRVPGWYYEYVDMKLKATKTRAALLDKTEELLSTLKSAFRFLDNLLKVGANIDIARKQLQAAAVAADKNIANAETSIRTALGAFQVAGFWLSRTQTEFETGSARELVNVLLKARRGVEAFIAATQKMLEAVRNLQQGNIAEADRLIRSATADVNKANAELQMGELRTEFDNWLSRSTNKAVSEINSLNREITALEDEADKLRARHVQSIIVSPS